ncbi:hypothetical protein WK59_03955 [Burkholderia ubonensis]|nr:hypothetical protein WK59_03955 [Burkholderia ubonensis]
MGWIFHIERAGRKSSRPRRLTKKPERFPKGVKCICGDAPFVGIHDSVHERACGRADINWNRLFFDRSSRMRDFSCAQKASRLRDL